MSFKDFGSKRNYIFSLSFLVTWLITLFAAFTNGLRFNIYVRLRIAEYITNLTGYEFPEEWVVDLFFLMGCLIFFIVLMCERFSLSDIINIFKKNKSLEPLNTVPYKKKSNKKKKRG